MRGSVFTTPRLSLPRIAWGIPFVAVLLVLATQLLPGGQAPGAQAQASQRPNVLIVLTDDQMIGSLARMPHLSSDPGGHWVNFTNAFVHYPLCCPSRATVLSGLYSHHHGVIGNGGGKFNDSSTIATWLDQAGYETALVGKYLNGYPFSNRPANYIPPGWDHWFAFDADPQYYDYSLNENGTWISYGATPADYSTDVLAGKAQAILSTAAEPFFLYFNTKAPHQSFTPAPRHKGLLQSVPITRSPNFNEADVSDKPTWVRSLPPFSPSEEAQLDRGHRGASETLLSVDEAIRGFMATLSARGILGNTVIVFMTDNGLSYGSHRWARDKRCVYEECVRTPLLIRYPWAESRAETKLVLNTDIAPTLAELAGISPSHETDGVSLVPLLTNSAGDWRSSILLEYQEGGQAPTTFWAVRTDTWKYAELSTGERELYDLAADPHELANVANQPAYAEIQALLAAELQRLRGNGAPPQPGNRPPVAGNDSYATMQETALTVAAPGLLANDSDPDGNPLSASKVADPAHGSVNLNANGSFTYTPAAGFSGTDSFSYRASDGTAQSPTAMVTITVSASGGGSSLTFAPSDDATVKQAAPTTSFNDGSLIVRKASNNAHTYLKFTLSGLSGPPQTAKLRLFVTDPSPNAGPLVTAANTTPSGTAWSEGSLTWNTKPALGTSALSTLGAVSAGTWVEYDLKASISANTTYSFALTGGSSDHAWFSSSEGTNSPQLVLTTGGPPPPPVPPVADFTASPRSGTAALAIQFSDASSGVPDKWAWDFQSDGTIDSTVQNPQFTYAGPGTYDVTLQVENSLGSDIETKLGYITVSSGSGPSSTSPPLISAVASERSALHARPGAWTGTLPITHTYQWQRCDSTGAGCTDIPDTTSRRYSLTESDVGATLQVTVTATNSGGSGAASSAVSGIVPPRPALPPGDPVIAAVGDIACPPNEATTATACRQRFTSDLAVDAGLTAILVPGDIQYSRGEYENFLASYDPTWGRVNGITYPAPGNHEYDTAGAPGYFQYFGPVAGDPSKGYYSVDIGTWHVVALNSNCSPIGGCGAGSAQEQWLRADLTAHPATCTLAFWHHPRFSSGDHGSTSSMQALWQALYDANADVVLSGHDHDYERFAPQTATGTSDSVRGIREFVVGTGGRGLRPFRTPIANSEIRNATTFGILKLTLHASGYDWQFVPEAGKTFTDTGSTACH